MTQEEKIKEAKMLYETANADQKYVLERLFPELKESKDERIRKDIIEHFNRGKEAVFPELKEKYNTWIAWIEKQGEHKSTWSEEDERMYKGLHNLIYYTQYCDSRKELSDWLKSIKDRCTWKPSEEQIKAVRLARSFVTDDFAEKPTLSDVLVELEKQLKKLREE